MKTNCWEFKRCGRQPNGSKATELGVCPVTTDNRLNGIHSGSNAGRACWMVAGSLCNGVVQGTFAQKMKNCMDCDFYNAVRNEERGNFKMSAVLMKMMEQV